MFTTALRRAAATLAVTAALGLATAIPAGASDAVDTAAALETTATAAASTQIGPTQVINDSHSTASAVLLDNDGVRATVRRGGYALHSTDDQFFTRFYVPRGTKARFYATDPYGRLIGKGTVLQEESTAGWHLTNAQVDEADLVMVKLTSTMSAATASEE